MSHLNMGEALLYKAKDFSSRHLSVATKYLEPNQASYVKQSLDHPYHVSLMQYKARHHLSYLQSLPTRNIAVEKLALAEFQINKLQHQREMQEVKRYTFNK
jgi:(3S)-linalool synthase